MNYIMPNMQEKSYQFNVIITRTSNYGYGDMSLNILDRSGFSTCNSNKSTYHIIYKKIKCIFHSYQLTCVKNLRYSRISFNKKPLNYSLCYFVNWDILLDTGKMAMFFLNKTAVPYRWLQIGSLEHVYFFWYY